MCSTLTPLDAASSFPSAPPQPRRPLVEMKGRFSESAFCEAWPFSTFLVILRLDARVFPRLTVLRNWKFQTYAGCVLL